MQTLPKHIAIIMDGNGRWAQKKNQPRLYGHNAGRKSVKRVVKFCLEFKIPFLSLFTFSTENFNRPQEEVLGLFSLLSQAVKEELAELKKEGVKVIISGDLKKLPQTTQDALSKLIRETALNKKLILNLCINYGGQQEIIYALNKILNLAKIKKNIKINKENFSHYFYNELPFPDLLIRTGGEFRISNFMLWQCAYTELYFTKVLWPDFNRKIFVSALKSFRKRQRRFGNIN